MTISFDGNKPALTDAYTAFVANVQANLQALGCMFDSALVTTANIPTGAKRINSTTGLFEQWSGTAWAAQTMGYALKTGDTFTGAVTHANNAALQWKDAGGTPRSVVNVNGSNALLFGDVGNAIAGSIVHVGANSSVLFDVNGTTIAQVNATGLGIGGAAAAPFHMRGNEARLQFDGAFVSGYSAAGTRGGYLQFNTGGVILAAEAGATKIEFNVGGTTRFTIDASGNATSTAVITGSRLVAGYDSGAPNSVSCSSWFRSNGTTGWYNSDYAGGIYMTDTSWVRVYNGKGFHADNSIRSEVDSASSYPQFILRNRTGSSSLHTYGAILWDAYRDVSDPSYVAAITAEGANPNANGVVLNFRLQNNGGGGLPPSVASLDTTGTFTALNYTATSDERLKTDWRDLPDDFLERLADVKMGTFTFMDSGLRQVGVGAQSFHPLLPEAVFERNGVLSVAYANAALASAIALAREVRVLRSRLDTLEAA
jgi:hypothetical protein